MLVTFAHEDFRFSLLEGDRLLVEGPPSFEIRPMPFTLSSGIVEANNSKRGAFRLARQTAASDIVCSS